MLLHNNVVRTVIGPIKDTSFHFHSKDDTSTS